MGHYGLFPEQVEQGTELHAVAVSAPLVPVSDFSVDLTDLVRDWLADPDSQHGVLLEADSEAEIVMYLASFEHSVTDWRPRLEITLTP